MAPHWKGEAISFFPARCAEGPASRLGVVMGTVTQGCDPYFGHLFSSQDCIGAF